MCGEESEKQFIVSYRFVNVQSLLIVLLRCFWACQTRLEACHDRTLYLHVPWYPTYFTSCGSPCTPTSFMTELLLNVVCWNGIIIKCRLLEALRKSFEANEDCSPIKSIDFMTIWRFLINKAKTYSGKVIEMWVENIMIYFITVVPAGMIPDGRIC